MVSAYDGNGKPIYSYIVPDDDGAMTSNCVVIPAKMQHECLFLQRVIIYSKVDYVSRLTII